MVIVLLDTFATEIIQQLTEPNRITMNAILTFSRRSLLLVALFLMGCLQLLAQTRTIKARSTTAMSSSPRSVWYGVPRMQLHSSRRWWMAARLSQPVRVCFTGNQSAMAIGMAMTREPLTTTENLPLHWMPSSKSYAVGLKQ